MKRLFPYVGAVVAFLAGALIINSVVSWAVATSESPRPASAPRAWFDQPQLVNRGILPGQGLTITVRFGDRRDESWSISDAGRELRHGRLLATGSGEVRIRIATTGARYRSLLLIKISGIPTPLSAWVL